MRFSVSFIIYRILRSKMTLHLTYRDVWNAKSCQEQDWPCSAQSPEVIRGSFIFLMN
jgi:hypothetical protein